MMTKLISYSSMPHNVIEQARFIQVVGIDKPQRWVVHGSRPPHQPSRLTMVGKSCCMARQGSTLHKMFGSPIKQSQKRAGHSRPRPTAGALGFGLLFCNVQHAHLRGNAPLALIPVNPTPFRVQNIPP